MLLKHMLDSMWGTTHVACAPVRPFHSTLIDSLVFQPIEINACSEGGCLWCEMFSIWRIGML